MAISTLGDNMRNRFISLNAKGPLAAFALGFMLLMVTPAFAADVFGYWYNPQDLNQTLPDYGILTVHVTPAALSALSQDSISLAQKCPGKPHGICWWGDAPIVLAPGGQSFTATSRVPLVTRFIKMHLEPANLDKMHFTIDVRVLIAGVGPAHFSDVTLTGVLLRSK